LYQREAINSRQLRDLNDVNKVRNLAAHGEIYNIEQKLGFMVDNLIAQLKQTDQ
jgi:hypothetical protein